MTDTTPVINGNVLTVFTAGVLEALTRYTGPLSIKQFSVRVHEDCVEVSFPVTPEVEEGIPGILHGARGRARDKEKPDPKPPTGGGNPDGTPPSGGTPGTPVLDRYTYTEARAA